MYWDILGVFEMLLDVFGDPGTFLDVLTLILIV